MARNVLRLVRGTKAQNRNYTGAVGEPVMATDTNEFYLHDGASSGGIKVGLALQYPRVRLTDLAERIGVQLVGDGVTIEGAALQQVLAHAAANRIKVSGAGRVFASAGTVRFEPGLDVEDLFVQATSTNLGANGRLLHGADMGATGTVTMRRVLVRVTGDATIGNAGDTMGFHLNGGANHHLEDIDVSAVGKRTLIAITGAVDSEFIRLCAHDGLYNDPTITDDCVQGIWLYGTTNCRLTSPRVRNLLGNGALRSGMALPPGVTSTAGSALWTRGISLAFNRDLTVTDPHVSRVDQGIDVSGSGGNVNVKISGGAIRDVESHGIKFANTAYRCSAIGTSVERAGRCAVVVSGPAAAGDNASVLFTQDNLIAFITAYDTGTRKDAAGVEMPSFASAGGGAPISFRVEQGSYAPGTSYPRGTVFDNCHSIDRQASPRTRRGFQNDIAYTLNSGQPNVVTTSCTSIGFSDLARNGFHERRVELQAATGNLVIPSGAQTDIDFSVEIYDPMDLHSLTSNANIVFLEPGVWRSEVIMAWPANASGNRQIDIAVNGAVQPALSSRIAGQGVEHSHISSTLITISSTAASNARILLTQSSGAALTVDGSKLFWRLERLR